MRIAYIFLSKYPSFTYSVLLIPRSIALFLRVKNEESTGSSHVGGEVLPKGESRRFRNSSQLSGNFLSIHNASVLVGFITTKVLQKWLGSYLYNLGVEKVSSTNGIPDAMSPAESPGATGTLLVFGVNRPIRSSLEAGRGPPRTDETSAALSPTRRTPEDPEAGEVPARGPQLVQLLTS
ncbi:hypothetical protein CJ030_MR4G015721 [Morella rubra]|uniref:Uncharacterized protein n=1 Tax=Morella rubra TaxID=262757 RepID=A0A6A1VUK9_9ROSI|nr:hypothetical protein CJ030_MR4G015721 [Morella rubra]